LKSQKILHHNPRMKALSRSKLALSLVTLLIWVAAAGSVAYWVLKISWGTRMAPALPALAAPALTTDPVAISRLLGAVAPAQAAQPTQASRFALLGVLAGTPGGGAALIAVDGKPARPVRVGGAVEEGLVLQSASGRQVRLAAEMTGPTTLTLEMPPLKN
jgi:general secretion pathway protein C